MRDAEFGSVHVYDYWPNPKEELPQPGQVYVDPRWPKVGYVMVRTAVTSPRQIQVVTVLVDLTEPALKDVPRFEWQWASRKKSTRAS